MLASPKRFERLTLKLEVSCSIQLSYGEMAGAKRFELLQTGLESVMLPLHQAPIGLIKVPIHLKP